MLSTILSGASASGTITPGPSQGIEMRGITVPSSTTITVSGALTGATTFNTTTDATLRFYKDEAVTLTTSGFATDRTGVINYVVYGSQEAWLNTRNMNTIPLPSSLTRRTPRSS